MFFLNIIIIIIIIIMVIMDIIIIITTVIVIQQKDVLKNFHSQIDFLRKGSFFSHVTIKFSLSQFNALWSAAQSKLPKNIFIFMHHPVYK